MNRYLGWGGGNVESSRQRKKQFIHLLFIHLINNRGLHFSEWILRLENHCTIWMEACILTVVWFRLCCQLIAVSGNDTGNSIEKQMVLFSFLFLFYLWTLSQYPSPTLFSPTNWSKQIQHLKRQCLFLFSVPRNCNNIDSIDNISFWAAELFFLTQNSSLGGEEEAITLLFTAGEKTKRMK